MGLTGESRAVSSPCIKEKSEDKGRRRINKRLLKKAIRGMLGRIGRRGGERQKEHTKYKLTKKRNRGKALTIFPNCFQIGGGWAAGMRTRQHGNKKLPSM